MRGERLRRVHHRQRRQRDLLDRRLGGVRGDIALRRRQPVVPEWRYLHLAIFLPTRGYVRSFHVVVRLVHPGDERPRNDRPPGRQQGGQRQPAAERGEMEQPRPVLFQRNGTRHDQGGQRIDGQHVRRRGPVRQCRWRRQPAAGGRERYGGDNEGDAGRDQRGLRTTRTTWGSTPRRSRS